MARTTLQHFRNETDVGMDDVLLNASNNSNTMSCRGMNQMTIVVNQHARASSTALTFNVEGSIDEGTTWAKVQTAAISSGTQTLSDATYSKALAATGVFSVNLSINFTHVRIRALTGASAGSGDKADVTVLFGSL